MTVPKYYNTYLLYIYIPITNEKKNCELRQWQKKIMVLYFILFHYVLLTIFYTRRYNELEHCQQQSFNYMVLVLRVPHEMRRTNIY